jgi:predicted ATP-dependent serine protease
MPLVPQPKPKPVAYKAINGMTNANALLETEFEVLDIGPYAEYFGKVGHNWDMTIHGEPGAGKSYFLLTLANWYAENVGTVLYVANEEYGSVTLRNKIDEVKAKSPNLYFSKSLTGISAEALSQIRLIIFDSINSLKMSCADYVQFRTKYPAMASILVLQKTKDGKFKGTKDWEHEVEINSELIKQIDPETGEVIRELVVTKNRYGVIGDYVI